MKVSEDYVKDIIFSGRGAPSFMMSSEKNNLITFLLDEMDEDEFNDLICDHVSDNVMKSNFSLLFRFDRKVDNERIISALREAVEVGLKQPIDDLFAEIHRYNRQSTQQEQDGDGAYQTSLEQALYADECRI